MLHYLVVVLKVIVSFIGLLVLIRIMGTKQLSQITFFDYIVGITIGSIVAAVSIDRGINLYDAAIATATWGAMAILVGYVDLKSLFLRKLTDGEPLIIIEKGIVNTKNMAKAKYNMGDLLMQLRLKEVFDLSEVQYAYLEPNGELSVLKKAEYKSVTLKDLKIKSSESKPMIELIINGNIMKQHLKNNNLTEKWLMEEMKKQKISSVKQVMFAGLESNGKVQWVLEDGTPGGTNA